ncbi:MAG: hypothetical protein EBS49_00255 [Verrucomicrobia bacterium]|nr:hypothetical protein [Verrucomicrobiota bacterium]
MAGTYLLDTAPLLYLMGQEDSVPASVRRELADPKTEVFYSQISLWEIQIKYQLGKLSMTDEPAVVLPRELARYGFSQLDLTDTAIKFFLNIPSTCVGGKGKLLRNAGQQQNRAWAGVVLFSR